MRSSLEGLAIGSGINLFKMLWNNFLMPMLVGKDTSDPALQKSYIARLYPAEVAAQHQPKRRRAPTARRRVRPGSGRAVRRASGRRSVRARRRLAVPDCRAGASSTRPECHGDCRIRPLPKRFVSSGGRERRLAVPDRRAGAPSGSRRRPYAAGAAHVPGPGPQDGRRPTADASGDPTCAVRARSSETRRRTTN